MNLISIFMYNNISIFIYKFIYIYYTSGFYYFITIILLGFNAYPYILYILVKSLVLQW